MFRDILVHVDASEVGRRRVRFAVDLATRTGARVTGLHVTPPLEVPPVYKASLVPEMAAEISSKLALDATAAAAIFLEEVTQRLPDAGGSKRRATSSRASPTRLDTPTLLSLASMSGKVRPKPIHYRSPTRSFCSAVAQYWSCPPLCCQAGSRGSPSPGTAAGRPSGQSMTPCRCCAAPSRCRL